MTNMIRVYNSKKKNNDNNNSNKSWLPGLTMTGRTKTALAQKKNITTNKCTQTQMHKTNVNKQKLTLQVASKKKVETMGSIE